MNHPRSSTPSNRYTAVTDEKASGATFTPRVLADFVANQILDATESLPTRRPIRLLDPAVGHGQLIISLLHGLSSRCDSPIEVYGFDTEANNLDISSELIRRRFPSVSLHFEARSFLDFILEQWPTRRHQSLFQYDHPQSFDFIIANPPYVRTQIIGADQSQFLARTFGLSGRVDLYYAFILGINKSLHPNGIAGMIVSNRFMTTRSGASVRDFILKNFKMLSVWDLGDTKLFDAAVLPAIILGGGRNIVADKEISFTSIYETNDSPHCAAANVITALSYNGTVSVEDGRIFEVRHGRLNTNGKRTGEWRVATDTADAWLGTVSHNTAFTFRDIGKVRVGVKTCADNVFIRDDWGDTCGESLPELLRPLTTHHIARRFKPRELDFPRQILYTHRTVNGRRCAVNLDHYPNSKAYLESHRSLLERRGYVIRAGRAWYEIWVPQDPQAWKEPKLVLRDISEKPTFWIDLSGTVINGDCYWIICESSCQIDLLWLAMAVGNSTFIEQFYDYRFNNKLYSGRRRFMTQYVERFPIPDPNRKISKSIISRSKHIYQRTPSCDTDYLGLKLDNLVWKAFGVSK